MSIGLTSQSVAALAWREIRSRWLSFSMTLLAVTVGTAVLAACLASLAAYDRRTEAILRQHAQETRRGLREYDRRLQEAMRKLGFNITILPKDQQLADFYADDFASRTMPEDTARRLAEADRLSIGHLVPVLRQKTVWPERNWTVLIVAFGSPRTGSAVTSDRPDVPRVPAGFVDIGWELHRALGLTSGDRIMLHGETFTLRTTLAETGSNRDISFIMNLRDAQTLLGMQGKINEIRALQCRTAWNRIDRVTADIQRVLPGAKVIQKQSETVTAAAARDAFEQGQRNLLAELRTAREDQRSSRVRFSLAVSALALLLALVTAGVLALINAGERRVEVAVWNAIGAQPSTIQKLFAWRALICGLAGGVMGCLAGAPWWGWPGIRDAAAWAALAVAAGLLAVFPAGLAIIAATSRTNPADVLKNEV